MVGRKANGKQWLPGLVNIQKAIENGHLNKSFPIKNGYFP
jgi:hypothetical protein